MNMLTCDINDILYLNGIIKMYLGCFISNVNKSYLNGYKLFTWLWTSMSHLMRALSALD